MAGITTDPVTLYRAACAVRGRQPLQVVRILSCGGDDNYDLTLEDGTRVISDPEVRLVIFEDWQRVRVIPRAEGEARW